MKPIPGMSGYYATEDGRIYSEKRKRFLSTDVNANGYLRVNISHDGKVRHRSVHRLVANTFLGENPGMEINHINGDKTDNRLCNLEWVTRSENVSKFVSSGGRFVTKKVVDMDSGYVFRSVSHASMETGIDRMLIANCCKGLFSTAGGKRFRYEEDLPEGGDWRDV